jgi:GT2 family glycosyltransferase
MMAENFIRIIVVSWNNSVTLQNCLESIKKADPSLVPSVILIDNHSTDGSIASIKKSFPEISIIENPENLGFAKGVNQGLQKMDTKYILLLNPDTQIFPDTISQLVEFLEKEPKVGIVSPKVLAPNETLELSFGAFPTPWTEYIQRKRYYQLERKESGILKWLEEQTNSALDVDWVSGVCLLTRREVIEKIGLLDEHYFMYFEDIDFCHRTKDAGWRVYYVPSSQILHDRGTGMRQNFAGIKAEYRKSQTYYYKKYGTLWSRMVISVYQKFSKKYLKHHSLK